MDDPKLSGARVSPALLAEYVRVLHEGGVARARIGDVEIEFQRDSREPRTGTTQTRPRPTGYDALLPNRPGFPRAKQGH